MQRLRIASGARATQSSVCAINGPCFGVLSQPLAIATVTEPRDLKSQVFLFECDNVSRPMMARHFCRTRKRRCSYNGGYTVFAGRHPAGPRHITDGRRGRLAVPLAHDRADTVQSGKAERVAFLSGLLPTANALDVSESQLAFSDWSLSRYILAHLFSRADPDVRRLPMTSWSLLSWLAFTLSQISRQPALNWTRSGLGSI